MTDRPRSSSRSLLAPRELARLVDPEALHAEAGPRAVLRVEAPAAWLRDGGDVELVAPAVLPCARCDGGGCDACARTGALRGPDDPALRILRATLPPQSASGVALRLVRPFGDAAMIDQLIVEVRPGAASSAIVLRSPAAGAIDRAPGAAAAHARLVALAVAAAALLLTVAWWVLRHA